MSDYLFAGLKLHRYKLLTYHGLLVAFLLLLTHSMPISIKGSIYWKSDILEVLYSVPLLQLWWACHYGSFWLPRALRIYRILDIFVPNRLDLFLSIDWVISPSRGPCISILSLARRLSLLHSAGRILFILWGNAKRMLITFRGGSLFSMLQRRMLMLSGNGPLTSFIFQ